MSSAVLRVSLCALTIAASASARAAPAETPAQTCDTTIHRLQQRVDVALRMNPLKQLIIGTRLPWMASGKIPTDRAQVLEVTATSVKLDAEVMPGATMKDRAAHAAKKLAQMRLQLPMKGRPSDRTLVVAAAPDVPTATLFDVMGAFIGYELRLAGRVQSPTWKDLLPAGAGARDSDRAAWNAHTDVLARAAKQCPGLVGLDATLATLSEPAQQQRATGALTALRQCKCALSDAKAFEHALPHVLGFCGADLRVLPVRVQITRGPVLSSADTPTTQDLVKVLEALPWPSTEWAILDVRLAD